MLYYINNKIVLLTGKYRVFLIYNICLLSSITFNEIKPRYLTYERCNNKASVEMITQWIKCFPCFAIDLSQHRWSSNWEVFSCWIRGWNEADSWRREEAEMDFEESSGRWQSTQHITVGRSYRSPNKPVNLLETSSYRDRTSFQLFNCWLYELRRHLSLSSADIS